MKDWSFQESYIWSNTHKQCSSDKQSPINIDTDLVQECKTLCGFDLIYKNSSCLIKNINNLIEIIPSTGSYFIYDNTPFELTNITIHVPSIHTIDGTKAEAEICLIHKLSNSNTNSKSNSKLNGIILSRLIDKGPSFGKIETFINQIINDTPAETINYEHEINVSLDWGPKMIIPKTNKSYFTYDGSLHYPPCTNNMKWFIYEDIGTIGIRNLETLQNYIGNNTRPIQRLNKRTVFYVINDNQNNDERKIYSSNNKYLKCMRNKNIIKIDTNTTSSLITPEIGLDIDLLKQIKKYILIIVVIILFIQAFIMVKYLYKHFYFQKFLKLLAGNLVINDGVIEQWKSPTCGKSTTNTSQTLKK